MKNPAAKPFRRYYEEPYRIFFPLGVFAGIVGVSHWLIYGLGLLPRYSPVFHSSMQMQVYAPLFICGFLMTAGPRFAGAHPASAAEAAQFLALFALTIAAVFTELWTASDLLFCLIVLRLAAFLFSRAARTAYRPPAEFVWIPIGLLCGLFGAAISALSRLGHLPPEALIAGKSMKEQGFVLSAVLGVGGFLGPRLLGFPMLLQPAQLRSMAEMQKRRVVRMSVHAAAGLCLMASFYLEGAGKLRAAYAVRAAVAGAEILWTTSVYRLPVAREVFAWLLWHSLWFVAAGYAACALWPQYHKALLHITFIGGFSLMIVAVGTMVIFSHSGQGERLKRPSGCLRAAGAGLVAAGVLRTSAEWFPAYYFPILAAASALWLAAGLTWLVWIAPRLGRSAVSEGESC